MRNWDDYEDENEEGEDGQWGKPHKLQRGTRISRKKKIGNIMDFPRTTLVVERLKYYNQNFPSVPKNSLQLLLFVSWRWILIILPGWKIKLIVFGQENIEAQEKMWVVLKQVSIIWALKSWITRRIYVHTVSLLVLKCFLHSLEIWKGIP